MILLITSGTRTFSNNTTKSILRKISAKELVVILCLRQQVIPLERDIKNIFLLNLETLADRCLRKKKLYKRHRIALFFINIILYFTPFRKIICIDDIPLLYTKLYLKSLWNKGVHYISYELVFDDELEFFPDSEYRLTHRADAFSNLKSVMIQDRRRSEVMSMELNLTTKEIPWFYIPYAPQYRPDYKLSNSSFRKIHNIADDEILLIHFGNLNSVFGLNFYYDFIKIGIPEGFRLVIHYTNNPVDNPYFDYISIYASENNNVILHNEYIEGEENIFSFLANFNISLALYLPDPKLHPWMGKNMAEIGLSSGKFAHYMACGIPTVTTNISYYPELNKNYFFGAVINSPNELKDILLSGVLQNVPYENCIKVYDELLDPAMGIEDYCSFLLNTTS